MRLIIALGSAMALFGQQQQQVPLQSVPDPSIKLGRITGKVLNAITGEPVRKATVSLQPAGGQQGGGQARGLSAATDNAGAFVFENVSPGNYRLSGEKTGFIRSNFGGRGGGAIGSQLAIAAGTEKADVIVRITPQGIVSGRILDEDGEPMEGVSIQLLRPQYFASQRRIMGAAGNQTNDRGEFRVTNVAPGKYYLQVQRMNNGNMPLQQGKEEFGYPKLFFPGVETIEQAQRVEVGAGQEVSNLQMALRKIRVYRVRGHVPGIAAPAVQQPGAQGGGRRGGGGMVIQLRPDGGSSDMIGPGFGPGMNGGQVRADGNFEIAGVSPGAYKLTLSSFGEGRPKVVGSLKLSVGNDNVEGVVLAPSPLVSVQGKIVVEGDKTAVNMKSVRVQLMPVDMGGMGFNPPIEVAADGSFSATELSQDKYRIMVTPGAAAYVKAVTVGGQNILDTGIDLSSGGVGPMEVLLSTKIATVNGMVEKQKHDDAPGSVVIAIVGANSELTLLSTASGQSALARVDESGKFSIANLPPGEYKLIAFEEVDLATASDPEFLKKFADRAATVKIGEGESKSATLKQIRFAETNPASN